MRTTPDEKQVGSSRSGWIVALLLIGFAVCGAATGFLSGWVFRESSNDDFLGESGLWLPGTIYGLFWLAVAWIGKPMAVRKNYRRSWLWTIGFLVGVTLSYKAAYHSAEHVASFLTDDHKTDLTLGKLMISGCLGGIPGGLGLVCMLGLMFRGFDNWGARSVLTVCSALLGLSLALWHENISTADSEGDEKEFGIVAFFMVWQSGMAVAIVATEAFWRSKQKSG